MELPIRYMTSREAADFLRIHPGTLKNWRSKGGGPKYHRLADNSIRYREDDLVRYVENDNYAELNADNIGN